MNKPVVSAGVLAARMTAKLFNADGIVRSLISTVLGTLLGRLTPILGLVIGAIGFAAMQFMSGTFKFIGGFLFEVGVVMFVGGVVAKIFSARNPKLATMLAIAARYITARLIQPFIAKRTILA